MMDPEPQNPVPHLDPDRDDQERGDVGPNDTILPMPGGGDESAESSGGTAWDLESAGDDEVPEEHPTV